MVCGRVTENKDLKKKLFKQEDSISKSCFSAVPWLINAGLIVRSVLRVYTYSILLAVERSHGCCGRELHLWQCFRRLGGSLISTKGAGTEMKEAVLYKEPRGNFSVLNTRFLVSLTRVINPVCSGSLPKDWDGT